MREKPLPMLAADADSWLASARLCWRSIAAFPQRLCRETHTVLPPQLKTNTPMRLAHAPAAEGGDFSERIPTPLLQPLLRLDSSTSEGSLAPAGGSPTPHTRGSPMAHSRSAALLVESGTGRSSGGAAGAAVVPRLPADSASSEALLDLESAAELAGDGGSALQRAVSEPMPIGQAGSRALPMLTPIM